MEKTRTIMMKLYFAAMAIILIATGYYVTYQGLLEYVGKIEPTSIIVLTGFIVMIGICIWGAIFLKDKHFKDTKE